MTDHLSYLLFGFGSGIWVGCLVLAFAARRAARNRVPMWLGRELAVVRTVDAYSDDMSKQYERGRQDALVDQRLQVEVLGTKTQYIHSLHDGPRMTEAAKRCYADEIAAKVFEQLRDHPEHNVFVRLLYRNHHPFKAYHRH